MAKLAFQVPILASDDYEPFCMLKAVKTLSYLEKVVNSVFGSITDRVQSQQQRVSSITNRIKSAQDVIESPVSPINTIITPIKFPDLEFKFVLPEKTTPIHLETVTGSQIKINETVVPSEIVKTEVHKQKVPIDKNELFNTKWRQPIDSIHSVDSIFVFETKTDVFGGESNSPKANKCRNEFPDATPSAAPISMCSNEFYPELDDLTLLFKNIEEIPDLKFPNDLPGLTNLSDFTSEISGIDFNDFFPHQDFINNEVAIKKPTKEPEIGEIIINTEPILIEEIRTVISNERTPQESTENKETEIRIEETINLENEQEIRNDNSYIPIAIDFFGEPQDFPQTSCNVVQRDASDFAKKIADMYNKFQSHKMECPQNPHEPGPEPKPKPIPKSKPKQEMPTHVVTPAGIFAFHPPSSSTEEDDDGDSSDQDTSEW